MKLSGSTKAIVRNVVGNLHVGEPDEVVREVVKSKLAGGAPEQFIRLTLAYAVKVHAANRRFYTQVMRGY